MASSEAAAGRPHPCRKSVQAMRSWDAPWCEPGPGFRWPGQVVRAHFMRKNGGAAGSRHLWPEACVGGGQPLPRTTSMSIPMTQNGAQPGDGRALLRAALGTNHDTIVIVMTGNPSVESSVEALRQGAFDYLPKPFSASHLQVLIGRAVHTLLVARETREQQETLDRAQVQSDKLTLLGTAPAFRRAIELARKVAPTDASVFITGESGSGKEMIAQFIHHHSRRSSRPFIAIK